MLKNIFHLLNMIMMRSAKNRVLFRTLLFSTYELLVDEKVRLENDKE